MTGQFLRQTVRGQHSGVEFPCRLFDVSDATRVHDHVTREGPFFRQRELQLFAARSLASLPVADFAAATLAILFGCGNKNEPLTEEEQARILGEQRHVEEHDIRDRRRCKSRRESLNQSPLNTRVQQVFEALPQRSAVRSKDDGREPLAVDPAGGIEHGRAKEVRQ